MLYIGPYNQTFPDNLWYSLISPERNSSVALIKHHFRTSSLPHELYAWCNETTLTFATAATVGVFSSLATTGTPVVVKSTPRPHSEPLLHLYSAPNLSCIHPVTRWPHLPSDEPFGLIAEGLCSTKRASKELDDDRMRTLVGTGCSLTPNRFPEVFFFSCLLFIGTFVLSWFLKAFKTSRYFRAVVRYE